MNLEDLNPGVIIHVPAGADLTRVHTYRLRLMEVLSVVQPDQPFVRGEIVRLDGRPCRRKKDTRSAFITLSLCTVVA